MANMSYCRFQNTLSDLMDCKDHIYDSIIGSAEIRARNHIIEICREIADEFCEEEE